MLFALSVCEADVRVILDDETHGDVLALIEAKDWQEARHKAIRDKVMDPYFYRAGHGWYKREQVKDTEAEAINRTIEA